MGSNDFDFIIGRWNVAHSRLNARLAGCNDWTTFKGQSTTTKILGGLGNLEDNTLELPSGPYSAVALRSFDTTNQVWSIWWLDGRFPGTLDKPVVGRFDGPVGTFYAEDAFEGRPIRIRFLWSPIDKDHARWEQAFSINAGKDWETNWTMEFSRTN